MILFQDNGDTVTFSPETLTRNPPWHEKLLAFYLLTIIIILLVRVIQLIGCLWELRKNGPATQEGWDKVWALGALRARSLMRLAILTFFLIILEMSLNSTNDLWAIGTQKAALTWWLLVEVAQGLRTINAGMIVCVALYACGFFFESRLEYRRLSVNTGNVPSHPPIN